MPVSELHLIKLRLHGKHQLSNIKGPPKSFHPVENSEVTNKKIQSSWDPRPSVDFMYFPFFVKHFLH